MGDTTDKRSESHSSREAILEAAHEAFSEEGFSRATLRDIARRAGVTHGLIRKHFGSKEELFLKAMPGTRDWRPMVESASREQFPETAARAFVERQEAGSISDVLVAIIRSSSERDMKRVLPLFRRLLENCHSLYDPLMPNSTGAGLRTELIVSIMIGLTFHRHVVQQGQIAELDEAAFESLVADTFERIITGRRIEGHDGPGPEEKR